MTVVAGVMVALNLESQQRIFWNWILGIGLAVNFGLFLDQVGLLDAITGAEQQAATVQPYKPKLEGINDEHINILSQLMNHYRVHIIEPGAILILPICMKLLVILTVIQGGYDVSFKLISGDKIKYMLAIIIKMGFMLFLMQNWIHGLGLMHALNTGFETIGYIAGGQGALDLQPDSICDNAYKIFSHMLVSPNSLYTVSGMLGVPSVFSILSLLILLACTVLLFLTAIEMFIARLEFYTMALLVMPLLPFMMTSKLSFLADKAIGAMFNLSIKCSVIAFLSVIIVPLFDDYTQQLTATINPLSHIAIMLQFLLMCLIVYLLVKKCSALVSGLLNGQPSFGGSDMTGTLTGAGVTAATSVGAVTRAAAAAKTGGASEFMRQLGKQAMMQGTTIGRAYASARGWSGGRGWNEENGGYHDGRSQEERDKDKDLKEKQIKKHDIECGENAAKVFDKEK